MGARGVHGIGRRARYSGVRALSPFARFSSRLSSFSHASPRSRSRCCTSSRTASSPHRQSPLDSRSTISPARSASASSAQRRDSSRPTSRAVCVRSPYVRDFLPMGTRALAGAALAFLATATCAGASAGSARPTGCSQLNEIPSVFPAPTAVGFVERTDIRRGAGRHPYFPGWCSRRILWTTYTGPKGSVDVRVSLYATARAVDAALAEPAYGAVQVQSNGARMRHSSRATETSTIPGVASAYRNLFISSGSESRVPIVVQWRIHHAIEVAFSALR